MRFCFITLLLFFGLNSCQTQSSSSSDLSIHPVYGSGSVWQRNQKINLTGTSSAGAKITFSSNALGNKQTQADKDGNWQIEFDALSAGGPYQATITSNNQSLDIQDFYVGDLFWISGQSNMEFLVSNSDHASEAMSQDNPFIRHMGIPYLFDQQPQQHLPKVTWQSASPRTTGNFSAVGYYFAAALSEAYPELPIGLVNSTWGGSKIEAWLPNAKDQSTDSADQDRWKVLAKKYAAALSGQKVKSENSQPIQLGKPWEKAGFPLVDGRMTFFTEFPLTANDCKADSKLYLGKIDDSDSTFVNGQLVGNMQGAYDKSRVYSVPKAYMKPGKNRLEVRVEDYGGFGGFTSPVEQMYIETTARKLSLQNAWRVRPTAIKIDTIAEPQVKPRLLYNAMLHPFKNVKFAGVLWYQGESNSANPQEVDRYNNQIVTLVQSFRDLTAQPSLPFLSVEVPNWLPIASENFQEHAHWAMLRQAQRSVLSLPKTGLVVSLGYGDTQDIHPTNKKPIGRFLADEAMRIVYGDEAKPRFSIVKSLAARGSGYVLTFQDVGQGLKTTKGNYVEGLAIQDLNGKWHNVKGTILGQDMVRVVGPNQEQIQAVSYAWSNNPDEANLINGWGRAVSSFRITMNE